MSICACIIGIINRLKWDLVGVSAWRCVDHLQNQHPRLNFVVLSIVKLRVNSSMCELRGATTDSIFFLPLPC